MRLIDADVLIKAIQQHMVKINSLFEEEKTVVEIIDAQPTAYDVEKVEEELLNKRELYRIKEIESLRKGEPLNIGVNLAKQASIEDCIDVVRRGGVE